MATTPPPAQPSPSLLQRTLGRFLTSRLGDIVANTSLGGRLITNATSRVVRRQTGQHTRQQRAAAPAAGTSQVFEDQVAYADLESTLKALVTVEGKIVSELVGNLFALTTAPSFSTMEVQSLRAFGQQAAAGLKNARLYHQVEEQRRIAEEQRQIAEEQRRIAEKRHYIAEERRQLAESRRQTSELFAKMAFNAATSAHELTNHIGMIRMPFNSIIKSLYKIEQFPKDQLQEIERKKGIVQDRLDKATIILKNLNEPWSVPLDAPTNINACLANAIQKLGLTEEPWIDVSLVDLPTIQTSSAMLSEVFRVIIKNAVEALGEKGIERGLWLQSNLKDAYIEVTIRDNGIGIKPENINKIFELGWTTKKIGLGFGLFWAKDFIEEGLKGKLLAESAQQKGTIFRINIPYTDHE